jgi:hypothetical protein
MALYMSESDYKRFLRRTAMRPVEDKPRVEDKPKTNDRPRTVVEFIDKHKIVLGIVALLKWFPNFSRLAFLLVGVPLLWAAMLLLKVIVTIPIMVFGLGYQVWLWSVAHADTLTALGLFALAGLVIYVVVYKRVK